MDSNGFVAALFCVAFLVVAGFFGSLIMRDTIKKECDKFGETYIAGAHYTCTAVGKTAAKRNDNG